EVLTRTQAYAALADDSDMRSALYESALIAYGRCFGNGRSAQGSSRRRTIADHAQQLPHSLREKHDKLIALRNRHVGHRVDHTESFVVADFDRKGNFQRLSRMSWTLGSHSGHVEDLTAVCEALIDLVNVTAEHELAVLERNLRGARITSTHVPKLDPQSSTWIDLPLEPGTNH
ncbi:hypothetical protein, partial [Microbacterium sp.]|uniref:hypothetical protein n=1 Tax=Microbacterium sp. TaxID=51671 RepID=UPI003F9E8333